MNALDALLTRRSVAPQYLMEPGPSRAQINLAIDAAARAPDHGRLQPWRFRLVQGAARSILAERLIAATHARDPATPQSQLDKLRARATTPLIIAVSALLRMDPKVPEMEQLLSAGAGVMNLLNAFTMQGFGAIWLTGPNAYDPTVAAALGLGSSERLLGFVYVGSLAPNTPAPIGRPAREQFVSDWIG